MGHEMLFPSLGAFDEACAKETQSAGHVSSEQMWTFDVACATGTREELTFHGITGKVLKLGRVAVELKVRAEDDWELG